MDNVFKLIFLLLFYVINTSAVIADTYTAQSKFYNSTTGISYSEGDDFVKFCYTFFSRSYNGQYGLYYQGIISSGYPKILVCQSKNGENGTFVTQAGISASITCPYGGTPNSSTGECVNAPSCPSGQARDFKGECKPLYPACTSLVCASADQQCLSGDGTLSVVSACPLPPTDTHNCPAGQSWNGTACASDTGGTGGTGGGDTGGTGGTGGGGTGGTGGTTTVVNCPAYFHPDGFGGCSNGDCPVGSYRVSVFGYDCQPIPTGTGTVDNTTLAKDATLQRVQASVDATNSSVDTAKQSIDSVKSSTDAVKAAIDSLKATSEGIHESVDAATLINKNGLDGVKSSTDAIKSSFDGVKSAIDSISASGAKDSTLHSILDKLSDLGFPALGDPSTPDPIPHVNAPASFSASSWGSGSCPSDVSGSLHNGISVSFSYQPQCNFAAGLAPVIIAVSFLTAGMIVLGGIKE